MSLKYFFALFSAVEELYSRLKVQRTANVHKLAKMNSNLEVFLSVFYLGMHVPSKNNVFFSIKLKDKQH